MYEYEAQMYAYGLKQVDKQYDMHIQAWINHQVTGTKKKGNKEEPTFKTFNEFFDYDKQIKQIEQKEDKPKMTNQMKRMAQIARDLNKKGG